MPAYKITISDEVTYARSATVTILAQNEDEARKFAEDMANDLEYPATTISGQPPRGLVDLGEDQVDNEPWEIEVELVEDDNE